MTQPTTIEIDGVHYPVPKGPAGAYQTYALNRPLQTHWRPATCAEVHCERYVKGWFTILDEGEPAKAAVAQWLRASDYRGKFTERTEHGLTVFTFPPGVACYDARTHRIALEREPNYLVQGGDFRGNPAGLDTVKHSGADPWMDQFATNQEKLVKLVDDLRE